MHVPFKGPKGIAPGFHSFDDRTYLRFVLEAEDETLAICKGK